MKEIYRYLQEVGKRRKNLFGGIILFFLLVGLITGTQAWQSISQRVINQGRHSINPQEVYLIKLEKDVEGKETKLPVKGAVFQLFHIVEEKETQIGGHYTTDDQGKIKVSLKPGSYVFEELQPSPGFTFDQDDQGQPIKRYAFQVTSNQTASQPIVTVYNLRSLGELELAKTVENKDGTSLSEKQRNQDFFFTVTFSDQGTYDYQIDGGKQQALKSGEELKLRHGQKAIFRSIPEGVHYQIKETSVPGYSPNATNSSGTITNQPSIVSFLNRYETAKGMLEISKKVVNGDGSEITKEQMNQDFTYEVTFSDKKEAYDYQTNSGKTGSLKSGATFTLRHSETLTFPSLPVGLRYTIKEKALDGYSQSPQEYQGVVRTTDLVRLPFVNEAKNGTKMTSSLKFKKNVSAKQADPKDTFGFELSFSEDGNYDYRIDQGEWQTYQKGEVIQIKAGQTVHFPDLPVGLSYTIREQEHQDYLAQLEQISGTVISSEEAAWSFYNFFKEDASLTIEKIGIGEGFDPEAVFAFRVSINGVELDQKIELKAGEQSQPIPLKVGDQWQVIEEAKEGYTQTALEQGVGVVTEPRQSVLVKQTNTYTLPVMIELKGKKSWSIPAGVSASLPENITVQLKAGDRVIETKEVRGPDWTYSFQVPKYDADGQEVQYSIDEVPVQGFKTVKEPNGLDLTNVYLAPLVSRGLVVEKKLAGDEPEKPETFEFTMQPNHQSLQITGSGQAAFKPIRWTNPGTYTYKITEKNKGVLGYTYDDSLYEWSVVIAESDGQLVIEKETMTKNGQHYAEENLLFTNEFKESRDKKLFLTGKKSWQHGANPISKQPKGIIVQLRADGEIVQQKEVTDADDWTYSFVANAYHSSGKKINYTITEAPVPEYQSTVQGLDLINRYVGNGNGDEDSKADANKLQAGSSTTKQPLPHTTGKKELMPQTNEKPNLMFQLLGGMLLGLVITIKLRRYKKKND